MKVELGDLWLRPDLFRFCEYGLLTDIERQLEHFAAPGATQRPIASPWW